MPGFELFIPNTERWRGAFKKNEPQVGGGSSSSAQTAVKLVSPIKQVVDEAKSEMESNLVHDSDGMIVESTPDRPKAKAVRKPRKSSTSAPRKQVRSMETPQTKTFFK